MEVNVIQLFMVPKTKVTVCNPGKMGTTVMMGGGNGVLEK